jgi:1,4-dihydroxy-2-naphthoate octaprenyltransferase
MTNLSGIKNYILSLRPKTLLVSVAPIVALSLLLGYFNLQTVLCLVMGLSFQIAVNQLNDYYDTITTRYTGTINKKFLKVSGYSFVLLGAIVGVLSIVITGHYFMFGLGVFIVLAAVFYSNRHYSYSYRYLGEVIVFLIYGPIFTLGSFVQITGTLIISQNLILITIINGILPLMLIMVDNIRDIDEDLQIEKYTLMNYLGLKKSIRLYKRLGVIVIVVLFLIYVLSVAPIYLIIFPVLFAVAVTVSNIVLFSDNQSEIPDRAGNDKNGAGINFKKMFQSTLILMIVYLISLIYLIF